MNVSVAKEWKICIVSLLEKLHEHIEGIMSVPKLKSITGLNQTSWFIRSLMDKELPVKIK